MNKAHKHDDVYYNILGIPSGSWLVCCKCGNEDIRAAHQNNTDLGWTCDVCPYCQ